MFLIATDDGAMKFTGSDRRQFAQVSRESAS